jgi:hypothetical protein
MLCHVGAIIMKTLKYENVYHHFYHHENVRHLVVAVADGDG